MFAAVLSECFITKIHGSWKISLLAWSPKSNKSVSTHFFYGVHGCKALR